jgi:hypothetical protein
MKLPEGFHDAQHYADEWDVNLRTVNRYCDQPGGLRYTRLRRKRIIHEDWAREFLTETSVRAEEPRRRRGRSP